MPRIPGALVIVLAAATMLATQVRAADGPAGDLGRLSLLSAEASRSVSAENFTGAKGAAGMAVLGQGAASHAARDLGRGWKVSPYVVIQPGHTFTMADISGPGTIRHIWLCALGGHWRFETLRMCWDGESTPSVECPVGDFFCQGWGTTAIVQSLAVCDNPKSGFNCYWEMPFRRSAQITLENSDSKPVILYYQIDYDEGPVSPQSLYFHAQFRRADPLGPGSVYAIIDGVKGQGQYVGTYLAWRPAASGWWGEGEIKFYLDGDRDFPTIAGTGTEDYFCGSSDFHTPDATSFETFTSPYSGLAQYIKPESPGSHGRFGMYRWHIRDPIHFTRDLKVTIQDLGWQPGTKYRLLHDDIASVAFWYQTEPHVPFPKYPDKTLLGDAEIP